MVVKLKNTFLSIGIIMICLYATSGKGQNDPNRITNLISQTNEIFISPFASGILLSPYEILQHNRSRTVKNIALVDSIYFITKRDTVPIFIKDNQTVIHKPAERFNSRTYIYHKDGQIDKVLRGKHLDDEYIYDKNGYLIQHGHGGELKKAKRRERTFEWYKMKNNQLVYVTAYDEQDRLESLKTLGQNNVAYDLENYTWDGAKVASKKSIKKYKEGSTNTSYVAFEYDSLGLIQFLNSREEEQDHWSKVEISSKIEYLHTNNVRIELFTNGIKGFSITFDQYDNWIELENYGQIKKRVIVYREKKRKK